MEAIFENTTKKDQQIAKASLTQLKDMPRRSKAEVDIEIKVPGKVLLLKIPQNAFYLLVKILGNMAEGKSNAIIQSEEVLSTQQAADILNVSRPYFVKLLEEEQIPYSKAGTHRRVELKDLLAFKKKKENKKT
jgi:excisionase family DNA binding protein